MNAENIENEKIRIQMNSNEALVFFNWLGQFNENENASSYLSEPVEENLLYDLEAALEKVISTSFSDDYLELLEEAKENVAKNR